MQNHGTAFVFSGDQELPALADAAGHSYWLRRINFLVLSCRVCYFCVRSTAAHYSWKQNSQNFIVFLLDNQGAVREDNPP
jgi:hypothetical protein